MMWLKWWAITVANQYRITRRIQLKSQWPGPFTMHFSLRSLFVRLLVWKKWNSECSKYMIWKLIYLINILNRLWKHFALEYSRSNGHDNVCSGWYSNKWVPFCVSRRLFRQSGMFRCNNWTHFINFKLFHLFFLSFSNMYSL